MHRNRSLVARQFKVQAVSLNHRESHLQFGGESVDQLGLVGGKDRAFDRAALIFSVGRSGDDQNRFADFDSGGSAVLAGCTSNGDALIEVARVVGVEPLDAFEYGLAGDEDAGAAATGDEAIGAQSCDDVVAGLVGDAVALLQLSSRRELVAGLVVPALDGFAQVSLHSAARGGSHVSILSDRSRQIESPELSLVL